MEQKSEPNRIAGFVDRKWLQDVAAISARRQSSNTSRSEGQTALVQIEQRNPGFGDWKSTVV